MSININEIIELIAPFNNSYRDNKTSVPIKIEMLWNIGNVLIEKKVTKPHRVAWDIQGVTKGIIKRPIIVRGYRIRLIWGSREEILQDLGNIKAISNLFEMLPLIDPYLEVRKNLSIDQLKELYTQACSLRSQQFNKFVGGIKKRYAHGSLGKRLNRERYLKAYSDIVLKLGKVREYLQGLINKKDIATREEFRKSMQPVEMMAFSNICIALTTKENFYLYKRDAPKEISVNNDDIKFIYKFFCDLLAQNRDEERARLRRLVPADVLAQLSDILSSLKSEETVADYRERQKIAINL